VKFDCLHKWPVCHATKGAPTGHLWSHMKKKRYNGRPFSSIDFKRPLRCWWDLPSSSLDPWHLKMGPIRCPETSVNNYHMAPRNIPEECRSYFLVNCEVVCCMHYNITVHPIVKQLMENLTNSRT
jgi:hypothetical protein